MKILCIICISLTAVLSSCIKGPEGPAGPSGVDALTDPQVKPKVIWTFPADGQVGPIENFGDGMSIRFNKIVDYSTVNKAITISPVSGYARIDTSNYLLTTPYPFAPTGDLVVARVAADSSVLWEIGQTYTVTIGTALKDVNGNNLESPYSFSFTPEPSFRVRQTYPPDGESDVPRYSSIEIDFNNTLDLQSIDSSITITPLLSGSFGGTSYYVYFSPDSAFSKETLFTITVITRIRDIKGRALSKPYQFSFTTSQY